MGVKSADTPRFDVVQFVSDNCVAICMLLAIVALSFTGVGNAMFVCALGAMLCVAILTKRSMKLDLWIFIPLVIYIVIGAIATFVTYGTLTEGYVCVEAVFLAIYLAIASMGDEEAFLMRRGCVAWAIVAGAVAIVLFACNAFGGVVSRLNWPLSGANAEGIFLVIAWFALRALKSDETPDRVLRHGEPIILVALALTLSLGSFGALVIGAIAMLLYGKRDRTWGAVGADAAVMVVELAIGVGRACACTLRRPGAICRSSTSSRSPTSSCLRCSGPVSTTTCGRTCALRRPSLSWDPSSPLSPHAFAAVRRRPSSSVSR